MSASEHYNILYAEDNQGLSELGQLKLEMKGHNVDTAENGREALEMLEQTDYDVVVSDFEMPEMNGAELLQEARQNGYEKPFWIYTNRQQDHIDENSEQEIGWTDCSEEYLSKSEGYDQLEEQLTQCILIPIEK